MKLHVLIMSSVVASFVVACSGGATTETPATEEPKTEMTAEGDTATVTQTPETQAEAPKAEVPDTVAPKAEPKADNSKVDREVEKILIIIKEQEDGVKSMIADGIPSSSSMAFRWIQSQPDYEARLKKIKKQLSPEQKAQIDAAEKRLLKAIDEWNDMPMN